ncbi:MAG: putative alpha/beta-hydrolase family hydrolase [Gammaproteobacteria bacterium]|jgi:predicted alpha/beta-hydrolase family hydrolase
MMIDRSQNPKAIIILAHGSGAPMHSHFMNTITRELMAHSIDVIRFEFDYMAQRRTGGSKRPPPKMPILVKQFEQVCQHILTCEKLPVFIAGKSMGGRVASLLAASSRMPAAIHGVACLGYPFHPPKELDNTRIEHLPEITKPLIIVQGTRDALGNADEVQGYNLPSHIKIHWLTAADHDFEPLKSSGLTQQHSITQSAQWVSEWIDLSL